MNPCPIVSHTCPSTTGVLNYVISPLLSPTSNACRQRNFFWVADVDVISPSINPARRHPGYAITPYTRLPRLPLIPTTLSRIAAWAPGHAEMQKHKNRIQSLVGPTDEEMAKKDDDHRPAPRVTTWGPVYFAPRRSARRLVVVVLLVVVIYVTSMLLRPPAAPEFRNHIPDFPTYHGPGLSHLDRVRPPSGPEPGPKGGGTDGLARPSPSAGPESRTSLSLPALSLTLKDMSTALGDGKENRNVLFASSSAKGAAALLPLACEMGRRRHNHVHYAVLSRDDMPIQKLQEIHGIDSSCRIIFHGMKLAYATFFDMYGGQGLTMAVDARPDYPKDSNDARVRAVTERALGMSHPPHSKPRAR